MRIAMLGHKRIPSREGGVEIAVEQLAVRMAAQGHQVTVYNRKSSHRHIKRDFFHQGVRVKTVFTIEKKSLDATVYAALAAFYCALGKYDIVHFHAEGCCYMSWLPKLMGKRVIVTIHGLDWQRAKWSGFGSRFIRFGEKTAVKWADEIIVLSQSVEKYFWETYGKKTTVIPNGATPVETKRANLIHEKWGLQDGSYILFLARLTPEKGAHYLLEAFAGLKTDKKLVIAGGSSFTDAYVGQLKERAKDDDRVILTGFVQGELLEELYSNAWLYVLPSDVEGMPLSLLEAMSYGNCCLVSDISENREVVEEEGFYFRKSDIADLKAKLEYLLENTGKVREKKENAVCFIQNKCNWDKITENTTNLYKKTEN